MQKIACLVIGVMLLCVGCSHVENVSVVELEEYSNNVWSDEKPQNEFVFNLYRTVVKNQSGENLAISPYGVQQLLDLARHGAAGETKTEIERVLGYTQSVKWGWCPKIVEMVVECL